MPKLVTLIASVSTKGLGQDDKDPVRQVYELHTMSGHLVCKVDPYTDDCRVVAETMQAVAVGDEGKR